MRHSDPRRSSPDGDVATAAMRMLTRRDALRAAGGAGAIVMFGDLLAACGGNSDSSSSTGSASKTAGSLDVKAGTDIPKATVRYGLLPYGDNSMPVIGMQEGWFEDVGITVQPQPV